MDPINKWEYSIVMLVYQRVNKISMSFKQIFLNTHSLIHIVDGV